MDYQSFFRKSTNQPKLVPYHYQSRLACGDAADEPTANAYTLGTRCDTRLISIPTGMGKTAAVIHAWLWNRVHLKDPTWPRRLVFCLPMRTLVEQTAGCARDWLGNLGLAWDGEPDSHDGRVGVHVLMGGESTSGWEQHPEQDAILIGTQDMLISRALNRGYGLSRFRWPFHFGLLNNDCLWVFDEIQLMGAALPTTTQLSAFRHLLGTDRSCHCWWMSATGDDTWLKTADFNPHQSLAPTLELEKADKESPAVRKLLDARKIVYRCLAKVGDKSLAKEISEALTDRSGLALVVVNTVDEARRLHADLLKLHKDAEPAQQSILLHSHFRALDRKRQLEEVLKAEADRGNSRIVISTQIVEAGVDLSSATLFTEIAPWSSLVQRFGRCNRRGEFDDANIYVIESDKSLPYSDEQLDAARIILTRLLDEEADASPAALADFPLPDCDRPVSRHIIRRRDLIDLFDTTPDLAGHDIDIDRWVRDIEDSKVQLFWKRWPDSDTGVHPPETGDNLPKPHRSDLCPAPIGVVKKWSDSALKKAGLSLWQWDHLTGRWRKAPQEFGKVQLIPGRIYLVPATAGGYDPELGFSPISKRAVPVLDTSDTASASTDSDHVSLGKWQSIAEHTDEVCHEMATILDQIDFECLALNDAARWHDLGKAHAAFAAKIKPEHLESNEAKQHLPHAKAPRDAWRHWRDATDSNFRRYFRHELASALAVLQLGYGDLPEESRDLIAWLIATHHGKIRLSIRSLPDEKPTPKDGRRVARGVHDDDPLPQVDLGSGVTAPSVNLSLEPMMLGLGDQPPFEDLPSWTERMLALRDDPQLGPLRLAWREALLRAADERASAKANRDAKADQL